MDKGQAEAHIEKRRNEIGEQVAPTGFNNDLHNLFNSYMFDLLNR